MNARSRRRGTGCVYLVKNSPYFYGAFMHPVTRKRAFFSTKTSDKMLAEAMLEQKMKQASEQALRTTKYQRPHVSKNGVSHRGIYCFLIQDAFKVGKAKCVKDRFKEHSFNQPHPTQFLFWLQISDNLAKAEAAMHAQFRQQFERLPKKRDWYRVPRGYDLRNLEELYADRIADADTDLRLRPFDCCGLGYCEEGGMF